MSSVKSSDVSLVKGSDHHILNFLYGHSRTGLNQNQSSVFMFRIQEVKRPRWPLLRTPESASVCVLRVSEEKRFGFGSGSVCSSGSAFGPLLCDL